MYCPMHFEKELDFEKNCSHTQKITKEKFDKNNIQWL